MESRDPSKKKGGMAGTSDLSGRTPAVTGNDQGEGGRDELDAFLEGFEENFAVTQAKDATQRSSIDDANVPLLDDALRTGIHAPVKKEPETDRSGFRLSIGEQQEESPLPFDDDHEPTLAELDGGLMTGNEPLDGNRRSSAGPGSAPSAASSSPFSPGGAKRQPVEALNRWLPFQLSGKVGALIVGGMAIVIAAVVLLPLKGNETTPAEADIAVTENDSFLSLSDVKRTRSDLDELRNRVEALSGEFDNSVNKLNDENRQQLATLSERLGELDARLNAIGDEVRELSARQSKTTGTTEGTASTEKPGKEIWVVNLVSLSDEKAAKAELKRLKQEGIRAEIEKIRREDRIWYRLRVGQFNSPEAARDYIRDVAKKRGYQEAWAGRR